MKKTKERIITAAMELFAEKGFRETTVAEICTKANANVAAVNYHFRDKDQLYIEVWTQVFNAANKKFPFDGGLDPSAPAEDHLKAHIASIINAVFSEGPESLIPKLRNFETVTPTGLMGKIMNKMNHNLGRHMESTVMRLLGPVDELYMHLSIMSILSQCFTFSTEIKNPNGPMMKCCKDQIDSERIIDHIYRFSISGIEYIRSTVIK